MATEKYIFTRLPQGYENSSVYIKALIILVSHDSVELLSLTKSLGEWHKPMLKSPNEGVDGCWGVASSTDKELKSISDIPKWIVIASNDSKSNLQYLLTFW